MKVICRKHFACFSDGPSASYSGDYRHTTRSFLHVQRYSYVLCTPADHRLFFSCFYRRSARQNRPKDRGLSKKKKKKKINPLRRGKRNVLRLVHIDRAFSHVFPKYQCLLVLSTLPGKSKRPCHIGNLMRNVGGTIPVFVIVLYPFLFWH